MRFSLRALILAMLLGGPLLAALWWLANLKTGYFVHEVFLEGLRNTAALMVPGVAVAFLAGVQRQNDVRPPNSTETGRAILLGLGYLTVVSLIIGWGTRQRLDTLICLGLMSPFWIACFFLGYVFGKREVTPNSFMVFFITEALGLFLFAYLFLMIAVAAAA